MKRQDNGTCTAILAEYKAEYMQLINSMGKKEQLARGSVLRMQDVYFILDGICALCMEGETGRDVSLIYFFPGRLLNFLPCLHSYYLADTPFLKFAAVPDFFVKTISDCVFLRIDHHLFLEKFFHSLPLHTLVVQALVENSYDLFAHIFTSSQLPAWQKVAIQIVANMEAAPPHALIRRMTYSEIASHLSLHVVTVAKIFKALQNCQVIARENRRIYVRDPERLVRIAHGKERLFYKNTAARDEPENMF